MGQKLTPKQAKFVKGVAEGKTMVRAAMDAYPTQAPHVASVTAAENIRKPSVKAAIEASLAKQELTTDDLVAPVRKALDFKGDTDRETIEVNLRGVDRLIRLFQMTEDKDGKNQSGNTFIFNNGGGSQSFIKK